MKIGHLIYDEHSSTDMDRNQSTYKKRSDIKFKSSQSLLHAFLTEYQELKIYDHQTENMFRPQCTSSPSLQQWFNCDMKTFKTAYL